MRRPSEEIRIRNKRPAVPAFPGFPVPVTTSSSKISIKSTASTTSPVVQPMRKHLIVVTAGANATQRLSPNKVAKDYTASSSKKLLKLATTRSFAQAARSAMKSSAGRSIINNINRLDLTSASISQAPIAPPAASVIDGYDPSHGPRASEVTRMQRADDQSMHGSQYTEGSYYGAMATAQCKLSGLRSRDYKQGDVISLPFHTPQLNPRAKVTDERISYSVEGPVYSKRRMVIVLWIMYDSLFCVPLYSHGNTGLQKKEKTIHEFVCLRNNGDKSHKNLSPHYEPIDIVGNRKPMMANTTVHITAGHLVSCCEDVAKVGRLTQDSHAQLMNLWQRLQMDHMNQPYRW